MPIFPLTPIHRGIATPATMVALSLLALAAPGQAHAYSAGGTSAYFSGGAAVLGLGLTTGNGGSFSNGPGGNGVGGTSPFANTPGGLGGGSATDSGADGGLPGWIAVGAGATVNLATEVVIGAGGGAGGVATIDQIATLTARGANGAAALAGVSGQGPVITNGGTLVGGGGGAGGRIVHLAPLADRPGASVAGGAGGAGLDMPGTNTRVINSGQIYGGGGGGGGDYYRSGTYYLSGLGGAGGSGVRATGTGFQLSNTGSIVGGNGGSGGGLLAAGGIAVEVTGSQAQIVQAGTIAGGMGTAGTTRGTAVLLAGNDSVLTLVEGSTTIGAVTFTGTNNQLKLGGSGATASVTVDGDLTLGAGNRMLVRATPASADRLQVTGSASLSGASVDVRAGAGTYAAQTQYDILSAQTLNGTRFAGATSDLAYLTPTLNYSADDKKVSLVLTRLVVPTPTPTPTPTPPEGTTPTTPTPPEGTTVLRFGDLVSGRNSRAVADAAETLPVTHGVYSGAINLAQGQPQGYFSTLSGEAHAGVGSGLNNLASGVRSAPLDVLRGNLRAGTAAGAPTAAAGASDVAPSAATLPQSQALPAWAQVVGNWQRIGATSDTEAVRQHTGGVFVGADRDVRAGWRLGGALGYTDSKLSVDELASQADVSSYSAIVYGGKAFELGAGKLNVMAGASYTWHDIATRRRVDAGALDQTLTADYGANTTQVFTELGYAFGVARGLTLEPYAGVAWAGQRTRAFGESGGSAALSGESSRQNTTTTTLGLRAEQALSLGSLAGTARLGVGWRHTFGDITPTSRLAFDAGDAFTVTGAPIARDAALIEAGVEARVSRSASLGVAYAGQFGGGNRDQSAMLNLNWAF